MTINALMENGAIAMGHGNNKHTGRKTYDRLNPKAKVIVGSSGQ